MSRESFIADMEPVLGHAVRLPHGQPDRADLLAFFRTVADRDRAVELYTEYARSFYIHVMFVPGNRDGDVAWPGGSCDRWSEIVRRPRRQSQRVIDCEGYAYLAAELLSAAGWRLLGYQVICQLPTQSSPIDYHLVAVLENPSDSSNRLFIGTAHPSPSAVTEGFRLWPNASFNIRYGPIEPDARRAIQPVTQDVATDAPREVAPMRQRRSVMPPP
jgi:hypothetical protein